MIRLPCSLVAEKSAAILCNKPRQRGLMLPYNWKCNNKDKCDWKTIQWQRSEKWNFRGKTREISSLKLAETMNDASGKRNRRFDSFWIIHIVKSHFHCGNSYFSRNTTNRSMISPRPPKRSLQIKYLYFKRIWNVRRCQRTRKSLFSIYSKHRNNSSWWIL